MSDGNVTPIRQPPIVTQQDWWAPHPEQPIWPPQGTCGPQPPSCFSQVAKAQACYDQSQALYNLVSQVVMDIFTKNPGIIPSPPPGQGSGPLLGVTDGSSAQPGQVGEWVQWTYPNIPVVANVSTTTNVSIGVLQPGDWDCFASLIDFAWSAGNLYALSPQPVGFSTQMNGIGITWDPTATPSQAFQANTLTAVPARASITIPTLVAFAVTTNYPPGAIQPGQSATLIFQARRMR